MILYLLYLTSLFFTQIPITIDDTGSLQNGKVGGWSSIISSNNEIAISYYSERASVSNCKLKFARANLTGGTATTLTPMGVRISQIPDGIGGASTRTFSFA